MKKIRAAVYTRVSTNKDEQLSSMKTQRQYYTDYCVSNGYDLVEIYSDEGISATSNNRKEFLRMLVDGGLDYHYGKENKKIVHFEPSSRDPKFDLIICKDVSRLARNLQTESVANFLDEKGVSIQFENSSLKTGEGNWKFELSLYLTFAENESRDRSNKLKWSLKNKANQKEFSFSVLPYGFNHDKEKKTYPVNPEEAEVIRMIFNMYVHEGKGTRAIADYLNANKIPNKKGSGKWVDTTIGRMIASERYIGDVVTQKYTNHDVTGSGKRIVRDKKDWTIIPNVLEPIVDRELWEQAQKIREERTIRMSDNSKKGKRLSDDKYRGKIYCSKCGSHFTRLATNKIRGEEKVTEYFYQCYKRRKHKECDMRGVSQGVLDREIVAIASSKLSETLTYDLNTEKRALVVSLERIQSKIDGIEEERKLILDKINVIDTKIDKLFSSFLDDDADEFLMQAVKGQAKKLQEDKKGLESQLEDLSVVKLEKSIQNVKDTHTKISNLSQKDSFTYEEILQMVDRISVSEGRRVTINLSVPTLMTNMTFEEETGEYSEEYFSDTGMDMPKRFEFIY